MAADEKKDNEANLGEDSKNKGPLDGIVQYVSLYVRRNVFLSGLVLPFLPLYLLVFYIWVLVYGIEEFQFKGLVSIVFIGLVHLLTILWCFWSAHVVAFVNCRRVKDPNVKNKIVFAKVVPTEKNGSPRMVRVNKMEFSDGTEQFYFRFRRAQYIWDEDNTMFRRHIVIVNNERRYPEDPIPELEDPIQELEDVVVLG